jgi:hypothetical protein
MESHPTGITHLIFQSGSQDEVSDPHGEERVTQASLRSLRKLGYDARLEPWPRGKRNNSSELENALVFYLVGVLKGFGLSGCDFTVLLFQAGTFQVPAFSAMGCT